MPDVVQVDFRVLPTWDQALDAIGDGDEPLHAARFGTRFDAQGVLAGSKDASRCIGYLTKYLTKHVGDCHQVTTETQAAHAERLADALRYKPCSPRCANWLRYGIQPKNARPGRAGPSRRRGQGGSGMKSGGGSSAHVGMYVGEDWWTFLSTYDDHTPILDVTCGSATVSLSLADRKTGAAAVEFARDLAGKAARFAAEVERLHAREHDGDGEACTACRSRRDGEAA